MSNLSKYVRKLRQQGYDTEYIRGYLNQYGYDPHEVEQALGSTEPGAKNAETREHKGNPIVFVIILLIIMGTVVFAVLKIAGVGEKEALLDVILEPRTTVLDAGEDIAFTTRVINLGSKDRFDVTLKYRLLDSRGGLVHSQEETLAISTTLTKDKTIPTPESPGIYELKVAATYEGKIATSAFTFEVKAKEVQQPVQKQPIISPSNLKDIEELAKTSPSQAEQLCLKTPNRDDCLSIVVRESRRPEFCNNLENRETKDNCYMSFIVEGQTYLCPKVVLPSNKQYCDRISDIQILAKYYD